MSAELYRPVAVDRIGAASAPFEVIATADECQALAARMQIPAIQALRCDFSLRRELGAIRAEGRLRARVTRVCVVSLDEFETDVAEEFALRFVPAGTEAEEIDPETDDEVPYRDATIDLGEATAEQLALALDPYPRKPGAVLAEEPPTPSNPFAALDALRRRH